MKVIYANIVLFIIVLYGLIGSAAIRFNSTFWQEEMDTVNTEYDIVWSLLTIWIIATIYGLITKKPWAYVHTLSINAFLAFVPLVISAVALFILWQDINPLELVQGMVYEIIISISAFVFRLVLYKSTSVKNAYNKSLNQIGAKDAPPG